MVRLGKTQKLGQPVPPVHPRLREGRRRQEKEWVTRPPLYGKIAEFEKAGGQLNAAVSAALVGGNITPDTARKLNAQIMQVESNWLAADGIPGRPWFKHLLYAARYTYAHLELPGLTEAAEKGDWPTAKAQAALLEAALEKNTQLLREARASLETAR